MNFYEAASLSEEDPTDCEDFEVILDAKCSVDFEQSAFYLWLLYSYVVNTNCALIMRISKLADNTKKLRKF